MNNISFEEAKRLESEGKTFFMCCLQPSGNRYIFKIKDGKAHWTDARGTQSTAWTIHHARANIYFDSYFHAYAYWLKRNNGK